MNDEIRPKNYSHENSGNPLPDLNKHPAHNETPIPLHRTRTEPSQAMSAEPMTYLLPGGAELRGIIKRRIQSASQSAEALWAALERAYQTRTGHHEAVLGEIATLINSGDLVQRDGELHIAEPTVTEIPAEMWTMTQTQRLLSVLTDEPRTRAWLADRCGLKPKQVSKGMNYLIGKGRAEVVGDVPRTWRRTEPKAMDDDELCRQILERLGDKVRPDVMIVADIARIGDRPADEARTLLEDMLACGYVVRHDDGRIGRKDTVRPAETEPETAVLTENQTRDVALERVSSACPEGVLVEDVARLSGWKRDTVASLLETMLRDGDLTRLDDERIGLPEEVKSEDPPAYEIGDDDDGEITEPGIARPAVVYRPVCVTVDFERGERGYINGEYSITLDADGLRFDDKEALPFAAIDELMPVLKRLHAVLWPCD